MYNTFMEAYGLFIKLIKKNEGKINERIVNSVYDYTDLFSLSDITLTDDEK